MRQFEEDERKTYNASIEKLFNDNKVVILDDYVKKEMSKSQEELINSVINVAKKTEKTNFKMLINKKFDNLIEEHQSLASARITEVILILKMYGFVCELIFECYGNSQATSFIVRKVN